MSVEESRKKVLHVIPPFDTLLLHRIDVILYKLDYRIEVILWVVQESDQGFNITVTCSSSHSRICCIQVVYSATTALYRIGKSKLLIVMSMNTNLLTVLVGNLHIHVCHSCHLLRVNRAVAVYNIEGINRSLAKHIKGNCNITLLSL